uniref:collagen binding domain-containing protein n=1 Tax=Metasolibacillus meyeri TaxID=1071052 RepID=UPI000D323C5A
MRKKINIAMLTMLLVFQTVIGPLSVFADEVIIPEQTPPATGVDDGTESANGEKDGTSTTSGDTADVENLEKNKPLLIQPFSTGIAEEIVGVELEKFDMTINGNAVTEGAYSTPLAQNQQANFNVNFTVPLTQVYADGSWFTFNIPDSLIDFSNAFNGTKTVDDITYTYTLQGGTTIRVEVSGMTIETVNTVPYNLEFNFAAGFNLTSDEIEQELELPKANAGSDTIKTTFKFLPSTNNERTKKSTVGSPALENGNHQMEWRVWVNEAGKDFVNPSITDNPTGGHAIIPGSVNVWQYKVGLNGVKTATESHVVINGDLSDVVAIFTNGHAYKIEYKTEVTLPIDDREDAKTFNNTFTFTNGGVPDTTSSVGQIVTYGKALAKTKVSGTNYKSEWAINVNYNQVMIPAGTAISDTIGSNDNNYQHLIDTNSIKVYEVTINPANGQASSVSATPIASSEYSVTPTGDPNKATGFSLAFINPTTKAYQIKYEANYEGSTFYAKNGNTTITNTAAFSGKTTPPVTHTLTNALLSKTRTVDFSTKEITWTVTIRNDHPTEDITGLTLDDQFEMTGKTGEHTLVGDASNIVVSPNTGSVVVDGDNKGFNITGINVGANSAVTVTYKTSFAITDAGTVENTGYGNTATTKWNHNTEPEYTQTRTEHYTPSTTTQNNGNKKGSVNYQTQKFEWEVRVNINKKDIQGAVLTDVIGAGHEFEPGTLSVYPLTLGVGDDQGSYTKTSPLTEGTHYTVIPHANNKGYILTFASMLDSAINNEAYVVVYKTKDSNHIFGIEDSNENAQGNVYSNAAQFQTKGSQNFTLTATPVTVDSQVANSLIKKGAPNQQASTETLTWTLDINKSHSNLGQTTVSDTFSDNLMLVRDSIELRAYNVTSAGVNNGSNWVTPQSVNATVNYTNTGFTLEFENLTTGYQLRYKTLATGKSGDAFSNEAKIEFAGATAENQKTKDEVNSTLSFSSSDSNLSGTKGTMEFEKVGVNSETGDIVPLAGVEFELYKRIGSTDYLLRAATTDQDGKFSFADMRYSPYVLKEVVAPSGYDKMADKTFTFNADYDTLQNGKVIQLVNNTPLPQNACTTFDLTVKDVNGNSITKEVRLLDGNGEEKYKATPTNGVMNVPNTVHAGLYTVVDIDGINYGTVTVKYGQDDCQDEVQPTNGCPTFTITLKDKDGNVRPNVTVTLKDSNNNVVTTVTDNTTNAVGEFTVAPTTPAGTYKVFEGELYLGDVNIIYQDASGNENCAAELLPTNAPACPNFTLTVNDKDGKPREGVAIKIVDKNSPTTEFNGTTNAEGKVVLPNLPASDYEVYENGEKIDEFTVDTNCEHVIQPIPACPAFTLTIENEDGPLKAGTKVVIENKATNQQREATVDTDGKITFATNQNGERYTIEPGDYTVVSYEIEPGQSVPFGEDFTVTYTTNCEDEVKKPRACTQFEITVISPDGTTPKANTKVIIEDENGIETEYTTDEDGKITLPTTQQPGKVVVYEVNPDGSKGERIDGVTVTYTGDCKGIVIKNACPDFTLTINNKDNLPVGANVKVTIKDKAGATVETGVTDVNGQIKFVDKAKLEQGKEYDVYNESSVLLGSITVSYIDEVCGAEVQVPINACPLFTLTIQNVNGNARANVAFVVIGNGGKQIVSGTTDADGKATVPHTVEPGSYWVVVGTEPALRIEVNANDCAALAKPTLYPGGGWTPPEPGEPTTPPTPGETPEEPTVPEEPTTPPTAPEEPTVPEEPTTPPTTPEEPTVPEE